MITKAQYERICRALLPEPLASEQIAAYNEDEGWLGWQGDDPFGLAFAALDPAIETMILRRHPELEPQIRALQKDMDGELAKLRQKYFKV